MKAVLINPEARTVTDVEFGGDYKEIYKLIDAQCFDVVRLGKQGDQEESMFVDDEGLYREPQFFFTLCSNGPFAGRGLILGTNEAGESVGTRLTAAMVEPFVDWRATKVVGWTEPKTEENAEMPWGGTGFKVIGARPIFEDEVS